MYKYSLNVVLVRSYYIRRKFDYYISNFRKIFNKFQKEAQ